MTDIEILKHNLQETKFPYFDDAELQELLDLHGDVDSASYYGCMIKAQDDSTNIGPVKTSSNEKYWLRRAQMFSPAMTGTIKRADGR